MRSRPWFTLIALILTSAATPAAAQIVIAPGIDVFTTPSGGATAEDFGQTPIPPGFFGPGSDPFTGSVVYQGAPLGGMIPAQIDTIVQRLGSANLPAPGSSGTVPIQIVGLSLVGTAPITVTYGGGSPEQWTVQACLSSSVPQPSRDGCYYLARAQNACATGSYADASQSPPHPLDGGASPCP